MKVFLRISLLSTLFLVFFIGSCKKQPKCGCDGDVIKDLEGYPVTLYYDTINNSAWFQPVSNPMSTYNFCNPSEHMDVMKRYENGSYLLVSGSVYWECNYLMRASNNPYYQSYYKAFMIDVTEVYEDLYGK